MSVRRRLQKEKELQFFEPNQFSLKKIKNIHVFFKFSAIKLIFFSETTNIRFYIRFNHFYYAYTKKFEFFKANHVSIFQTKNTVLPILVADHEQQIFTDVLRYFRSYFI